MLHVVLELGYVAIDIVILFVPTSTTQPHLTVSLNTHLTKPNIYNLLPRQPVSL
jgi:hypothetical protein